MAKSFSKAFYNSKAWQVARAQALHRDSYTCCSCGGHAEEVHHIVELTPENINDQRIALALDNLQSLCHDCHTKETKGCTDVPNGYVFDTEGNVIPSPPFRKV